MRHTQLLSILLAAAALATAGACGSGREPGSVVRSSSDEAIIVGSFDFNESRLLAEVYAQALRAEGYPAELADLSAPREILEPALEQGFVDLVPEYLGTSLSFLTFDHPSATVSQDKAHRSLSARFATRGVEVLDAAPAENKNEVVVLAETARRLDLTSISDLDGPDDELVFGGPPECPERLLCLKGLSDVYGLEFSSFVPLDAGGPLTIAALLGREVDAAVLFTTDPAIDDDDLVVLEDDRELQPPENIVPVLRAAKLEQHGDDLARTIDEITSHLDGPALRDLNGRVVHQGLSAARAASLWLALEDLT